MSPQDTLDALKQHGPCTAKALGQIMKVGPSGVGSCLRRLENHGEAKRTVIKNPTGRGGRSVTWEAL